MSALESQLQASIDIIELRKRDSSTLAAVIKAAQAELQARKAKLRSDVADLAKQKKALQRTAAELSGAGIRIRARAQRKDKGSKRGPKLVPQPRVSRWETCLGDVRPVHVKTLDDAAESLFDDDEKLDAQAKLFEAEEAADEDARDDYERQNAARGNEP